MANQDIVYYTLKLNYSDGNPCTIGPPEYLIHEGTKGSELWDAIIKSRTSRSGSQPPREVLYGHPPKKIEKYSELTLHSLDIRNRDAIIVRFDSHQVAITTNKRSKSSKRKRGESSKQNSDENAEIADLGEKLVQAASGSSSSSEGDDILRDLRRSFKQSVQRQYEITEASNRLQAALSKDFTAIPGSQSTNGTVHELHVTFKVGKKNQKEHKETVRYIPDAQVKVIVKTILDEGLKLLQEQEDKESGEIPVQLSNLRPYNMADISPALFWNIARIHGGEVKNGLQRMFPGQDFSFLEERDRRMSAKGKASKEYLEKISSSNSRSKKTTTKKKMKNGEETTVMPNVSSLILEQVQVAEEDDESLTYGMEQIVTDKGVLNLLVNEFHVDSLHKLASLSAEECAKILATGKNTRDIVFDIDHYMNLAQGIEVDKMMILLVPRIELRQALADSLGVENVRDLARLRIPGRYKIALEECNKRGGDLSDITQKDLEGIQQQAQELVNKIPYLQALRAN